MQQDRRELPPPRMFPRTEGQAKASVAFLIFVVMAGLAYAVARGFNLFAG